MQHLRTATDEEKDSRDRLAHAAWGARLSVERFVARERELRATAFARKSMTTWLWCDRADHDRVLASCETFRMRSRRATREGHTYAIASVFTEEALRGRGYATQMIAALIARVRQDDVHAQALVLYSDVGARIYERSGFVAVPACDWVCEVSEPLPHDLAVLPIVDDATSSLDLSAHGLFAIDASRDQLDWHLARERIYSRELDRPASRHIGARVGDERVVWTADWKNDRLVILYLRASAARDVLLDAARRHAHAIGLPSVVCWSDDGHTPRDWTRIARDGSLPMIHVLPVEGPDGLAATAWSDVQRILWV